MTLRGLSAALAALCGGISQCSLFSGYCFATDMPSGRERSITDQLRYWKLLKARYEMVDREDAFGQNATPLIILMRK